MQRGIASGGVFLPKTPPSRRLRAWECCWGVLFLRLLRGEDVEDSGLVGRLGTVLYAELAVDSAVVSFDGVQGEEKPLANLTIRESLGNEL